MTDHADLPLELFDKYVSEELSDEEARVLLNRLEEDPECRDQLCDTLLIHFALHRRYQMLRGVKLCDSDAACDVCSCDDCIDESEYDTVYETESNSDSTSLDNNSAENDPFGILLHPERLSELFEQERNALPVQRTSINLSALSAAAEKKKSYIGNSETTSRGSFLPLLLSIFILAILIGTAEYFGNSLYRDRGPAFAPVARVRETINAVWDENAEVFKKQQEIGPNRLSLKSGLVQLDFYNGAQLILEGPGEYIIRDEKSLFCDRGKISGYVKDTNGFEIVTPVGAVIDRGTAFAVDITRKGTDVEVVQGAVDLVTATVEPTRLVKGQGSLAKRSGGLAAYSSSGEKYISNRDFQNRLLENVSLLKDKRDAFNKKWDAHPNLLLRYDFSGSNALLARNTTLSADKRATDAIIAKARIGKGRLYGTRSVLFSGRESLATFDVSGKYRSLTLTAIVRVDRLQNQGNVLFAAGSYLKTPGSFLWQLAKNGTIQCQLTTFKPSDQTCFDSPVYFSRNLWGTWVHLALVIDGDKKTISHYADGVPLAVLPWNHPIELRPGAATIGNYHSPWGSQSDRFFGGAFEDFRMFDGVLTEEEITMLAEEAVRN